MVRFHCKVPKTEKYQIFDFDFDLDFDIEFDFFFFLVGLEMKVRERKKNGTTKRDSGQGV